MNFKKRKSLKVLKTQFLNTLMSNGKKNTTEKILLNTVKLISKLQKFHLINLLKLAFINSTPIFKLNEQLIKRGKKKVKKQIPFFLLTDSTRILYGIKTIKTVSSKTRGSNFFYKSLGSEILNLTKEKSNSIRSNIEIKTQVLANKRYLSKFRW